MLNEHHVTQTVKVLVLLTLDEINDVAIFKRVDWCPTGRDEIDAHMCAFADRGICPIKGVLGTTIPPVSIFVRPSGGLIITSAHGPVG